MSRYFLCDYCEYAKRIDVFNAECDKYGVTSKRTISDEQCPHEVCDYYAQISREEIVQCRACRYFPICSFTENYADPEIFYTWGEKEDE